MNRLHPRIQVVWVLRAVVTAAAVGGGAGLGYLFLDLPPWTVPAAFAVALSLGVPLAIARYRRWGFEIRDDELYLERGVITEVRTVVPFVRLQHVDSRRGPLERSIGLASVVVYTAGSRGADVHIPGLTNDGAQELRERLKRLAIRTEAEDAV